MVVAIAALLLLALGYRALTTFDLAWDTVAYHAPWAARLFGLCDVDCFTLWEPLERRFHSFPVLVEWLQGLLWRVTGLPETINLVSFCSLVALILYLRTFWEVPWTWATIALCAVPFVQIFATSAYVDLPTNAAATIALLAVVAVLLRRGLTLPHLLIAAIAIVFLGNSKTQLMLIAGLTAVALILASTSMSPASLLSLRSVRGWMLSLLLGLALSATAIKNLLLFGNPVYPVQFLGMPRVEFAFINDQSPEYLRGVPHWLVWPFSIFEFSALDGRHVPYTSGNGDVPATAPSYRMGGYFGFYVMISLGAIAIALHRSEARTRAWLGAFILAVTVVTAFMPASSELRYYMFWFLIIISLNLWLFLSPQASPWRGRDDLAVAFKAVVLCVLAAVVMWTGGRYLVPGERIEAVLVDTGVRQRIDTEIVDGSSTCIPELDTAFLYAEIFHPGRDYVIVQQSSPSECEQL